MSRRKTVILILVGVSMTISLLVVLSRRVATRKVGSLLRSNQVISKTQLSFSWPLHWHFVIDALYTDEFFSQEPNEVSDQRLICISLRGDYLRAFPAHPNDVDLMNVIWNSRMDCVYGRGTNWVVETNPTD